MSPRALVDRMPFRARLAAAFSGLFLLAGIALLTFVVLLARYGTKQQAAGISVRISDHEKPTGPDAPGRDGSGGPEAELPGGKTDFAPTGPGPHPSGRTAHRGDGAAIQQLEQSVQAVQDTALRQMLLWSGVGLVVMAVLAGLLGWWLAGRALRPVASMTEAARRISEQNLHQRLALTGPDDELHRLADTFDSMLDRIQKYVESQRRFVANASHELKTPLAVQRTSLQVGLVDPLPDGLADVREDLLDANRDAVQLVDALLLLARSDRGPDETEPVDLAATARLATTELTPLADDRAVHLELDTAADPPPTLRGDPVLLRHLLTNLIRNAVQYNHPGGDVCVRLDARTLTVTNTGPHVPPERIPDLFEPFRRLDADRTATSGHGLGLSIAASIAEAHHATLTAHPRPTGGLTLTLHLP
ncbi:HAMP domain-containing histidine kinase [Streptomyces sp. XM4193]|uniref:sensor histidine kinase n=1 Tax=Streptomyces sp. XM4193 TaxID=2929782 RepID=UPI001FF8017C|nr:HAMP domain-containing sensor histidine kinase [Streptomyces sp. XM4193]MCK1796756.1 HAMP domain-containing histidine kinase [Streptomyces sp. XM4193]